MRLISPAFVDGQTLPSKFTCDGAGVNPELVFSEIPPNTQSFVLICHDPDAPRPGGFTHWVIINMSPETRGIGENSKPASGVELTTDYGKPGYGAPCPPSGTHRYIFYLYALDENLNLSANSTKTDVETGMKGHVIEKAELVGLYERQT